MHCIVLCCVAATSVQRLAGSGSFVVPEASSFARKATLPTLFSLRSEPQPLVGYFLLSATHYVAHLSHPGANTTMNRGSHRQCQERRSAEGGASTSFKILRNCRACDATTDISCHKGSIKTFYTALESTYPGLSEKQSLI
jgi:hypothetical protein